MKRKACFFSNESLEAIEQEQYSIQDINILKDLGFDVVIANKFSKIPLNCDLYFSWWASGSIMPLIKARFSSKPIIIVAGGNEVMKYRDSVSGIAAGYIVTAWYKKLATILCLRFGTQIIVVSNFMLNNCLKFGSRETIVVHNSVDTNKFTIANKPREFITMIFKADENVVRLKRGENFLRAIPEVLQYYPDQIFVIIGTKGEYYPQLERICKELQIVDNVKFVGNMRNELIVDWMQRSIAYIQISDTETFGVAIAEAMSCGTQVIVSNRGAIPEVVGDNGVYVDHNNIYSISEGMCNVLKLNETEYGTKGEALRKRIIDNFSYETRKKRMTKIIAQVLR